MNPISKFFLTIFVGIVLVPSSGLAKKDTTIIYCNYKGVKTKKKYASTYKKVYQKSDNTFGVEQYSKLDVPIMKGSFKDKGLTIKQGVFTYYDLSANVKEEGKFVDNKKDGVWRTWFKGELSDEGRYKNDYKEGVWLSWSGKYRTELNYNSGKKEGSYQRWENDTLIAKGQYLNDLETGEWKLWYVNETLKDHGHYVDGKRDGEWLFYFESGKPSAIENYEKGELKTAKWMNEDGAEVKVPKIVEQDPSFAGGEAKMMRFIQQTILYPSEAIEMGEQGVVYVQFVIEEDGSLSNFKVVKGATAALDKEALRVTKAMPKWIPAVDHNRPCRVRFVYPIHFRLG